jgi:hypothetical protein
MDFSVNSWDRCYDLKNIFVKKSAKLHTYWRFDSKQIQIMPNYKHLIGFREERQFFSPENCRKSQKIMVKTSTPVQATFRFKIIYIGTFHSIRLITLENQH